MSVEDVCAFVPVSDTLATAGQPSEAQLSDLSKAGFEVVINLGLQDPRYCLPDEGRVVTQLGMSYHHIPVEFSKPTAEDLSKFFDVMDRCRGRKVLVHCAANYRVSCFVSVYAQARLGWSEGEAMAFVRDVWEPDETWLQFMSRSKILIEQRAIAR